MASLKRRYARNFSLRNDSLVTTTWNSSFQRASVLLGGIPVEIRPKNCRPGYKGSIEGRTARKEATRGKANNRGGSRPVINAPLNDTSRLDCRCNR